MKYYCPDVSGLDEFRAWMESAFAKVKEVDLSVTDSGETYHEIYDYTQCRDAELDIRVAREDTWKRFVKRVNTFLKDKTNDMTLMWRIVPEDNLQDSYVVMSYDENGPDKDFITDKRCYADKAWKVYAVYARFAIVDG